MSEGLIQHESHGVLILDILILLLTHVWTWVNEQVNNEPRMTSFQAWGKWKPSISNLRFS